MAKANRGFWSLLPLIVFLALYMAVSVIIGDFYKVPITVAFVVSTCVALAMTQGTIEERIAHFSRGASDKNIMLMIWIFILAGAFAQSAKTIGAVDATVNLALSILPDKLVYVGIFVAACFVSLSIGTSVGTIVALVPIAAGIADKTGSSHAFVTAIVVGGAFFGDNLSFISDTTIAATQSQGCSMRDKFKANIAIVLPAALIAGAIYLIYGISHNTATSIESFDAISVLPYIAVIGMSLTGMNVLCVLAVGLIITGVVGVAAQKVTFWQLVESFGTGMESMGNLIIVTLLAGGMLELIRVNGGIDYIINLFSGRLSGKRPAELMIAGLVSVANLCTANNTIAIITTGSIARNISVKFGIDSRKAASILDTFSCFVQGLIPYGAQMLMASQLSGVAPMEIIGCLYYPFLLGIIGIVSILVRYPKKYS